MICLPSSGGLIELVVDQMVHKHALHLGQRLRNILPASIPGQFGGGHAVFTLGLGHFWARDVSDSRV